MQLDAVSSGMLLVVGMDTDRASKRVGGDQLVTAWRAGDLVGLARKTFPSHGDTHGRQPPYPVFETRLASNARFVALPGGHRVVLLGCYDAFGTRSIVHPRHADVMAMRLARDRRGEWHSPSMAQRRTFLARWSALIAANSPDLALCAIHGFTVMDEDGDPVAPIRRFDLDLSPRLNLQRNTS